MHVTIADYGPDHALRNKDEAEVYGRALHARQQALCALQGQSTPGRAGHLWRDDCECADRGRREKARNGQDRGGVL